MNKQDLANKYKAYKVLIHGTVATVILLGVYFIRTGPVLDLEAQYSELREEVDLLLANQRNGGELNANLETIKQYTDLMNERFISQNLADIHDIFYTLERESGVTLDSFQRPEMVLEPIVPKANKLEYQPLSMAVTISGAFKNVIKFVQSLENSPLLYRYNGLKVSAKARTADSEAVSLTLNLDLLSLNDQ